MSIAYRYAPIPRICGIRSSSSAPCTVWVFMTSNSSAVSLPGLHRIASGMAILPTSCMMAASAMSSMSSAVSPSPSRVRVSTSFVMSWMRWTWSPLSPSRNSIAADSASIIPRLSSMMCCARSSSWSRWSSTVSESRLRASNSSTTDWTRRMTAYGTIGLPMKSITPRR